MEFDKVMMTDNSFMVQSERRPSIEGVSVPVPEFVTSREAMERAGLNWQVETRPIFLADGKAIPEYRSVVRTDTGEPLGIVKQTYKVLQNEECFDICDEIAGEGGAKFEAAGSLNGGRTVFAVMRMPEKIVLPGDDVVERKLLFLTSHDGSLMTRMIPFTWRLFCANQFGGIIGKGRKDGIAVRHTRNAQQRLRQAGEMLGLANNYFRDFAQAAQVLQRTPFLTKDIEEFAKQIFPAPNESAVHTRTKNNRERLIQLFEEGAGQKGNAKAYGTAWGAFHAVTEYVDHYRNTRSKDLDMREELRFKSAWFESGAELKQKAFDLLMEKVN